MHAQLRRGRRVFTMKRPSEDTTSDSDMGETIDVGSENNYSGRNNGSFIRCGSPTTMSQVMARKKRRGIIEKRRRDRINNSLTELRRLVPTAFEKQGSAKLEKAEILQMTVDHLKMLQATGGKGYFDTHSLAMDFLSIGFWECVTEVTRYLSSVEGLEGSDPLRLRLVSHLSSCASQRETSSAISSSHALHPHWAAAFPPLTGDFLQAALPSTDSNTAPSRLPEGLHHRSSSSSSSALLAATFSSLTDSSVRAPSTGCIATCSPALSTSLLSLSAKVQAAAAVAQTFPLSFPGGFPIFHPSITASSLTMTAASPPPSYSSPGTSTSQGSSCSRKPYRPWGTEVGVF